MEVAVGLFLSCETQCCGLFAAVVDLFRTEVSIAQGQSYGEDRTLLSIVAVASANGAVMHVDNHLA